MDLAEMLADETKWPTVRDLIRSEQIYPERIAEIYRSHPAFAAWMAQQGQ